MSRQTVGVDVDGVLHSYTSGWQGADKLPDPPVPGAIEWLVYITRHYDVAICSTRANTDEGCRAIFAWLREHGFPDDRLPFLHVSSGKPPALIYLDDRAVRFTGSNWPTHEDVAKALPWWKAAKSSD